MPDEASSKNPSEDAKQDTASPTPVSETTPPKAEMGEERYNIPAANQEVSKQSPWNSLEIIKLCGEVALIVIGTIALCVYGGQLNQMKKSVEKMGEAIAAANRSATAAETANTQSKDQFREDQRPYVWQTPGLGPSMGQSGNVKMTPPGPDTNYRVTCGVAYQNYGRSPAIIIRVGGDVQVGIRPFQRFKRRSWKPNESVLPPGKSDLLTLPADPISPENLRGEIACYFRIQYQDTTGHPYETDMCFHGLPRAGIVLSYCPTALHLNRMIDCKTERCE